ncbi:MAG: ligase-associated DNA damage response DEXH box helicase [Chloroflexota bacterium]|nr:ligase-associated DNA damage response DEXH box helicase [Chloroflexota bacterium]
MSNNVSGLDQIEGYFASRGWAPFAFQREAWHAYSAGESGLIHAATGTGKTLAVWLGILSAWLDAPGTVTAPPLQALWITPLRALAADTAASLQEPLTALNIPWTLETRTGDSSSTVRGRQRKRLPSALVTTPESLTLFLARADGQTLFSDLKLIVIDEWHELIGSKRGVQTELALARLRRWCPEARVWGVSATLGNLDVALRALLGIADFETGEIRRGLLIQGHEPKAIRVESILPRRIERFPWAGHLGLALLDEVIAVIARGRTALVFTNTRAQAEIWYQAILDRQPDWAGEVALHHGSLDADSRRWVEAALKEGRLRCVVCTSSLDLGVDFAPVDSVIQVGSPKGVGRLLQRAGRSGHQPGIESKVTCAPTHAFELIEAAAARDAMLSGRVEPRIPVENALDVLSQHLVTIALGGGFTPDDLYREVRTSYAYRSLTRAAFEWTVGFAADGGALAAYPEYHRLTRTDEGRYIVDRPDVARVHRMSIGTIVSEASLKVQFMKGAALGHIDESFAARLQPGDKFTFAGRVLEFVRVRDMTAWVRLARSKRAIVPRWFGGGFPLSAELASAVRAQLDAAIAGRYESPEMVAVKPILDLQAKWSRIPASDETLIERTTTRDGNHIFIFPFGGKLVNEGLAALCATRLSRRSPITFTIAVNDYGFELLSPDPIPIHEAIDAGLFTTANLTEDILASLNAGELARRQFREIARIAGLVIQRFPGGQKSAKQLQASTGLIYDVFEQYDPGNLLLLQARYEVLERQLEVSRLVNTLDRINAGRLTVIDVPRPTPLAFPLIVERIRETISSETLADRVAKMQLALERATAAL